VVDRITLAKQYTLWTLARYSTTIICYLWMASSFSNKTVLYFGEEGSPLKLRDMEKPKLRKLGIIW